VQGRGQRHRSVVGSQRKMEDSGCESVTRLSKGIHVVLRPDEQWRAAAAVSLDDGQHLCTTPKTQNGLSWVSALYWGAMPQRYALSEQR
jgi:hypothetical protein